MNRRLGLLTTAILAVLAAGLLLAHMPVVRRQWVMQASTAALRAGEHMQVPFPNGLVDVNRASAEELQALRAIGPVTAQRIVEERELRGPFFYPEDLLNVPGIGEKTLVEILSQIHLN